MSRTKRIRWYASGAALAVAALAVMAVVLLGSSSSAAPIGPASTGRVAAAPAGNLPVYRMDADHETYPALPEISTAADTIVTGQVLSHTVEPGESPGVDALGDPLPAVPHTVYAVAVYTVLKGGVSAGATIDIVVAGGSTPEGEYVLEGAPAINDGETALFFLVSGGEGRYYPLAGGAAVATRDAEGNFSLSPDATGEVAHTVSEAEVQAALGTQPPPSSGSSGGGGGATGPTPSKPTVTPPAHQLHCHKGFAKKKVKGKLKCVKQQRHHKAHKHHKRHKGAQQH
ncbi:MAG TPA: hypothetical protein VHZ54_09185 [Solirubrobacterales bacterium]|jgi:hypothetical protein|nr:hypothetical protein [Solirubrobacterales bacterium]